jgi:hypothetical protein
MVNTTNTGLSAGVEIGLYLAINNKAFLEKLVHIATRVVKKFSAFLEAERKPIILEIIIIRWILKKYAMNISGGSRYGPAVGSYQHSNGTLVPQRWGIFSTS